jgi:hypothetical protein
MAVLISLGGSAAGDGFLVAPVGSTYDAQLVLATDAGNLAVTLQASPNPAGLVFSQTNLNLSTAPTTVAVHATAQSGSRGDTTIQVLAGANVVASFTVTSIKHPKVNFKGRFQARFATDSAPFNQNPMYTATVDTVGPGWTWGLEGEPNFVPVVGNVPENLETPVGRVVRLNNPVALRSHAAPVVSTVYSITGDTVSGPETFFAGDPLIGQPVDFGPNTYLAGNNPQNFSDPKPEEFWSAAQEPMALFELHFGNLFSGTSRIGPFIAKAAAVDTSTRSPDSRPIANGLASAATELAEFGLPTLQAFSETRIDLLVTDYNALPPGASPDRRNLARRIGHLLTAVSLAKRNAVQAANPGAFTPRTGTLDPQGWEMEIYQGKVDANLQSQPGGSSVVAYLADFTSFNVEWRPFAFHSDELCGHHKGSLTHLNFDGSYSGDPHTRTVDGTSYDFQAVGEFTLLRDGNRLEIQVRQSPVATQNPLTDSYTGLTACVSINTAVAMRLGKHRIALQPGREGPRLEFYLDGKPASLSTLGIDLGGHRVSAFDANGELGMRVDSDDQTGVIVTPAFWNAYKVWYMNVSVSNTRADEGIMGFIPRDSWLPRLRDGTSVGPMPASLHDRYVTLYRQFADSWRVTDQTSLFVYHSGTSSKTFTDRDWPAEKGPCTLKPQFQVAGVEVLKGMPVERARMICAPVNAKDLNRNCVFDVATTGDEFFAEGYLLTQELRTYGTYVTLVGADPPSRPDRVQGTMPEQRPARRGRPLRVTATVLPITPGRPTPTGGVTFIVDGVPMKRPLDLDGRGRARITLQLMPGEHRIRATYCGGGRYQYHSSSSPNLVHTVIEGYDKSKKS